MASDLTSASLSYSNYSYILTNSSSATSFDTYSDNDAAISETANLSLQVYDLFSTAFFKDGIISLFIISDSFKSLETVVDE